MCWCNSDHPRSWDEAMNWDAITKARKAYRAEPEPVITKSSQITPESLIRADLDSRFPFVRKAARRALDGIQR